MNDQDPNLIPIIVTDVWEHAYYMDYFNMRRNYVTSLWKIANWPIMEKRFTDALSQSTVKAAPISDDSFHSD